MSKHKGSLSERSISIWALTWPIMIEMTLQFMLGTADTIQVSRISDDAVAVVGIANQFFNAVIVLFSLVCSGAGILIAQKLGANKQMEARQIGVMSVTITAALGIIISILLASCTDLFITMLNVPVEIRHLAHTYMSMVGGGMIITALNLSFSTAVRNTGDTRSPMLIAVGMNILHILMNYAFIFGAFGFPQWGLYGVGISMLIARGVAMLFQIRLFTHAFGERIRLAEFFKFNSQLLKEVVKLGWPLSMNGASWTFSQLTIYAIIATMGAEELATRTYMNTIESFAFLFGWSLAMGVQIRISYLYGARRYREAYYDAFKVVGWGIVIVIVNTVLMLLFRHQLLSLFTDDQHIIDTAMTLLWLNLILQPGKMLNMALGQSLNAIGDSRNVMLYSLPIMWITAVGLSYVLAAPLGYGLLGIYAGMILDEYLRGAVSTYRWRLHRRKKFASAFDGSSKAGSDGSQASTVSI
ncbi:MATE family efflux transporter [Paenibacillus kobensis]|uniref:MATE family efflux transporter n=1 Tax=Paenibacillus kobensis TaxID=59841 RepID=UPI000FDB5AA0|nr:MATE family efflux transporter [Paenibacillus kobensis]